jgi:hypothetical protein
MSELVGAMQAGVARQGSGAVASLLGCPGRCAIALGAALSHLRRPLDAIDRMEGGGR